MEVGLVTILYIIVLLIALNFILMFLIFFNKKRHKIEKEKIKKMDEYIIKEMIKTYKNRPYDPEQKQKLKQDDRL